MANADRRFVWTRGDVKKPKDPKEKPPNRFTWKPDDVVKEGSK